MITIDGSQGEGGGQVVRSSLALSLVTGKDVAIRNIRAGRRQPGLRRQHLMAVQAARKISGAKVSGSELGSSQLTFKPRPVTAGDYEFRISTAGSSTLVLQTILPALMIADETSTVRLTGGTHNPLAPPYDFLQRVYLPLLGRLGPEVTLGPCIPGFYPAGGGSFQATIRPHRPLGSCLLDGRGELVERRVRALVSALPREIAERECQTIASATGWDDSCFVCEEVVRPQGPGNVVMIELQYTNVTELFTGFGEKGKRAEQVARGVLDEVRRYEERDVPVGPYLADQLLLPLALSASRGGPGGRFRTMELTPHSTTHKEVLQKFLDVRIDVTDLGGHRVEVEVS